MSWSYKLLYWFGALPWERVQENPAGEQARTLFDETEAGHAPPHGRALDMGCGRGIWSVHLAERGWEVTGIDIVPGAVDAARSRAREAGVEARFLTGSITDLRGSGVEGSFELLLDFGVVHGLSPAQVQQVGHEVDAVAAPDATLIMLALSPGWRGPMPRGLGREEVEAAFVGWTITDERALDPTGLPRAFERGRPRWFRLRRRG